MPSDTPLEETSTPPPVPGDPEHAFPPDGYGLPVGVKEYLRALVISHGRSENTVRAYERRLRQFEWWLDTPLHLATPEDVANFLRHMRDRGMSSATRQQAYAAIKGLYKFLQLEELVAANPVDKVKLRRASSLSPATLSVEQMEAVLNTPDRATPVGLRDAAVMEMLYGCGLRVGELVGLNLESLNRDDQSVRVLGKGSKERVLPVGKHAWRAVTAWMDGGARDTVLEVARDEYGPKKLNYEAMFVNQRGSRFTARGVQLLLQDYGEAANMPNPLTPHVLRHSCATHMIEAGAEVRVLQEFLGHASLQSTQRYLNVSHEQLLTVYHAAHPRGRTAAGGFTPARRASQP